MLTFANNGKIPAVGNQNRFEEARINSMIPMAFSEGVSVCTTKTPYTHTSYLTEYFHSTGTTYCTSVTFVQKFIPQHYITTLTVDEDDQQCITSYEITPFYIQKTIPDQLSVTSDVLETKKHKVTTTLVHDPNREVRHYISGINFEPVHVTEVKIMQNGDQDSIPQQNSMCNGFSAVQTPLLNNVANGDISLNDEYVCTDNISLTQSVMTLMDVAEKTVRVGEFWFTTTDSEKAFLVNNLE